ncbi:hypothetical protein C8J57DRAFT_1522232 [Mycena rebaudengoi]|nr:hypothetical protein C8J57DRAFT_1522232 [Mycena rebaudengoi]
MEPAPVRSQSLNRKAMDKDRQLRERQLREHVQNMDPVNRQEFLDLQEEERPGKPSNVVNMANVLDGSETFNISHAGGEFAQSFDLQQGLEAEEDIEVEINPPNPRKKYVDNRTCRDRAQLRANAFEAQMADMLKAYMAWCAKGDGVPGPQAHEGSPPAMEEVYELTVVDLYECYTQDVVLEPTAGGIAPSLILQGLMPCAPWTPTVAISTRVLEPYWVTHVRCPQLAVQPFVKSLCDLHGVPFWPYLMQQFSIAKPWAGTQAGANETPAPLAPTSSRREPADDDVEGSVGKSSERKDT